MNFPPYPKYKPSGVEWLGDVPEHWETWKHAHLFNSSMGQTILREDVSDAGPLPVLSATEEYSVFGYVERAEVVLNQGDLVIPARGNSIGHVKLVRERCTTTQTTIYSKHLTQKVAQKFAFYFLLGNRQTLFQFDRTAIPQLTVGQVSDNAFLLPPLPEQSAIADFLDARTGKLDALAEKKRALIEKLKEKRSALISRTVTKGLPAEAAAQADLPTHPKLKPSGIDWLGDIPEHWEVKKLSWLFKYRKGREAATLTKEYVASNEGAFAVYSGQTANDGLMGTIDTFEFDLEAPAILVTTVGARAMTTRLVDGKFSLSQNCALIIPRSPELNTTYYEGILRGLFEYERRSISLIMQPSLRFEDLDRFHVPKPISEEQTAIAAYLDTETSKIDRMIEKVEAALEKLAEYRTALITAAVTGKIDVRNMSADDSQPLDIESKLSE